MIKNPLWLVATVTAYILGIGTGILIIREQMERKYRKNAQEEIDSVKAAFSKKKESATSPKEQTPTTQEMPSTMTQSPVETTRLDSSTLYEQVIADSRHRAAENPGLEAPYIIELADFVLDEDYSKVTYTYYADGVLVDDNREVVEPTDDIFKSDFTRHFGEYDAGDCVYVRNDEIRCDYEIVQDEERYSDIAG